MSNEVVDKLKELAKKDSLFISRVPKKTKEAFKSWAFEEFEGDYGMAFKWLMDFKEGTLSLPDEEIMILIGELDKRISVLESKPNEENTIKLGDGKRIEVKRK